MAYKVIMTWDIASDKEREYFEFVVREFIPGLQKLGFDLSDAWATVYGKQPQILLGAVQPTLKKVDEVLSSDTWKTLQEQLSAFIQNFDLKVVESKNTFQF
jgi:hypothetical protein